MAAGKPVAGIDRWRGGWIIADLIDGHVALRTADNIATERSTLAGHSAVAIDMPIALAAHGRRSAEAELRATLGASSRSVFTSPTRAAVDAPTQAEATVRNRANGGPGISAQAFGLFASIQELRAALRGGAFAHWWETHPEAAFALMNDGTPLASKRTARGVGQRLELLRHRYPGIDHAVTTAPEKVPVDDVLDAVAAAWSAERIATDCATVFGPPDRDDEGFARGIRI